jgi:hypothetical protein
VLVGFRQRHILVSGQNQQTREIRDLLVTQNGGERHRTNRVRNKYGSVDLVETVRSSNYAHGSNGVLIGQIHAKWKGGTYRAQLGFLHWVVFNEFIR